MRLRFPAKRGTDKVAPAAADRPLSGGTRLIHVGPYKTGTTGLQGALHRSRDTLSEHGVFLPSPQPNPIEAVRAVLAKDPSDPRLPAWRDLVDATSHTADRVAVLSSEILANADDEDVATIIEQLGGQRVHVVVTLRPVVKILASQWQHHVTWGITTPYEEWLRAVLLEPDETEAAQMFWHQHRHDRFVERWAAGDPERLTVIVVDESDRDMMLRSFEGLLGLDQGLLTDVHHARNRSLTAAELAVIRHCFDECARLGWSRDFALKYVRAGAIRYLQTTRTPGPGERRIGTPRWAQERAVQIGAEIAAGIAESGVRVIGALDSLPGSVGTEVAPAEVRADPALAASAMVGILRAVKKDTDAKG